MTQEEERVQLNLTQPPHGVGSFEYWHNIAEQLAATAEEYSASAVAGETVKKALLGALTHMSNEHVLLKLKLEDAQKTLAVADDTLEGRDNQLKDTMRERNLAFLLIGQQVVEDILTEPVALCEVSI